MKQGYMLDLVIYETETEASTNNADHEDANVDYDLVVEESLSTDGFMSKHATADRLNLIQAALLHYRLFVSTNEREGILNEAARGVQAALTDLMRGAHNGTT